MKPVVLLGIDGLDFEFVHAHLEELPSFAACATDGALATLPSIFPPDSIPAWITVFTGLEPAEHGIVESIDYLAKRPTYAVRGAPDLLRGRTFWDQASELGYRVCVINPFMAYPAWPVNGAMVSGPVFGFDGGVTIESSIGSVKNVPALGGSVAFPTRRTLNGFLTESIRDTQDLARFSRDLFAQVEPDLMFVNVLTVDRVQHFFWRFYDEHDPTYPGRSQHSDAVLAIYKAADEFVETIRQTAGADARILIMSDHGHGMRPPRMFYLDEWLRRNGYVHPGGLGARVRTALLDGGKRLAFGAAYTLGAEETLERAAKRVPGKKALKTSSYSVGPQSVVAASRKFGRNSASGIVVRNGSTRATASLITELSNQLVAVTDPLGGPPIVEWVRPREEVIRGPHEDVFPELLLQLRPDIGVDFGLYGPLFARDVRHRRLSGGHRPNGVFAATRPVPRIPERLAEVGAATLAALQQ